MLFPSVAFFPAFSMSVDPPPLISAAPPAFSFGVNLLSFVIVADHHMANSERTIPGLFLHFGVKIIKFDDQFSYLLI